MVAAAEACARKVAGAKPADRVALSALLGFTGERNEHDVAALMNDESSATLAAAAARRDDPHWVERTAGAGESRAAVRVGRLLASGTSDLDSAADAAERGASGTGQPVRGSKMWPYRTPSFKRYRRESPLVASAPCSSWAYRVF